MKNTYIRTFNVDARHPVPDKVYQRVERILSHQRIFDNDFMKQVHTGFVVSPEESLYDFDISFYPDIIDCMDDLDVVAGLMLLLLRKIPVISRHQPKQQSRELWGLYSSCTNSQGKKSVWIELYSDTIFNISDDDIDYERRLAETLLHELAHAVMDVQNYGFQDCQSAVFISWPFPFYDHSPLNTNTPLGFAQNHNQEECPVINSANNSLMLSFYQVREESLANVLTYRLLHEYVLKKMVEINVFSVDFLQAVMKSQPSEYRLALYLLEARNVSGWMKSKISQHPLITYDMAERWMAITSDYIRDFEDPNVPDPTYDNFSKRERALKMPWSM